jgi:hypothetical protein
MQEQSKGDFSCVEEVAAVRNKQLKQRLTSKPNKRQQQQKRRLHPKQQQQRHKPQQLRELEQTLFSSTRQSKRPNAKKKLTKLLAPQISAKIGLKSLVQLLQQVALLVALDHAVAAV